MRGNTLQKEETVSAQLEFRSLFKRKSKVKMPWQLEHDIEKEDVLKSRLSQCLRVLNLKKSPQLNDFSNIFLEFSYGEEAASQEKDAYFIFARNLLDVMALKDDKLTAEEKAAKRAMLDLLRAKLHLSQNDDAVTKLNKLLWHYLKDSIENPDLQGVKDTIKSVLKNTKRAKNGEYYNHAYLNETYLNDLLNCVAICNSYEDPKIRAMQNNAKEELDKHKQIVEDNYATPHLNQLYILNQASWIIKDNNSATRNPAAYFRRAGRRGKNAYLDDSIFITDETATEIIKEDNPSHLLVHELIHAAEPNDKDYFLGMGVIFNEGLVDALALKMIKKKLKPSQSDPHGGLGYVPARTLVFQAAKMKNSANPEQQLKDWLNDSSSDAKQEIAQLLMQKAKIRGSLSMLEFDITMQALDQRIVNKKMQMKTKKHLYSFFTAENILKEFKEAAEINSL